MAAAHALVHGRDVTTDDHAAVARIDEEHRDPGPVPRPPDVRAMTMAKSAPSAPVMKCLSPSIRQPPATRTAAVRMARRSEPAPGAGSVIAKHDRTSPLARGARYWSRCSLEPTSASRCFSLVGRSAVDCYESEQRIAGLFEDGGALDHSQAVAAVLDKHLRPEHAGSLGRTLQVPAPVVIGGRHSCARILYRQYYFLDEVARLARELLGRGAVVQIPVATGLVSWSLFAVQGV